MASACVAPCLIGLHKPEMTAFQISLQLTASVTTLIFQRYEWVDALAFTHLNAIEVSCLSALNHIL